MSRSSKITALYERLSRDDDLLFTTLNDASFFTLNGGVFA